MTDQIQAPVAKACLGLVTSGGCYAAAAKVASTTDPSFFPTTLAGWLSVASCVIAMTYTAHLLGEWYWKKVVKPWLQRRRYHSNLR